MRFIGCKNNLINNIEELVDRKCINASSFCDIFAGTGTVGSFFKKKYNTQLYFVFV